MSYPNEGSKTFSEYLLEPTTLIAIFALIVSIVGLGIAIRYNRKTLYMNYIHNKLSVKPFLILLHDSDTLTKQETLSVQNCGTGPAILKSVQYIIEDREYPEMFDLMEKELVNILQQMNLDSKLSNMGNGHVIAAQQERQIFIINYDPEIETELALVIQNKVKVKIEYKSIYEEDFLLYTHIISDK
jgi:phosphoribosylaminoimidazole (AIR) synthetase